MIDVDFTLFVQIINFLIAYFILNKLVLFPFYKQIESENIEKENYVLAFDECVVEINEKNSFKQASLDKYRELFFKNRPNISNQCSDSIQMINFVIKSDKKTVGKFSKDKSTLKNSITDLIAKV